MLRTTLFAIIVCSFVFHAESGAQSTKGRKLMESLDEIPDYPPSLEEFRRRTAQSRDVEARRMADQRTIRFSDKAAFITAVNEQVDRYLQECKARLSPEDVKRYGLNLIESPRWLDKRLLKFVLMESPVPDQTQCRVVFDQAFYQHVLKRGRQLRLKKETKRFPWTLIAFGGVFGTLCIVYGILKVFTARAAEKHQDFISVSRISMV